MLTSGRWDVSTMTTHHLPLTELDQAIRTAADTTTSLNVVIDM